QEGDHARGHGNELPGADVDVVHLRAVDLDDLVAAAHGDALVFERAVLGDGLVGLGDDVVVFLVGGHVLDDVSDHAGGLVDLAVGRLDKAVFVDARVGGQRTDQAVVRAFRRLDGADAAVVRIVHVAHGEGGAVAVETAGAEGR